MFVSTFSSYSNICKTLCSNSSTPPSFLLNQEFTSKWWVKPFWLWRQVSWRRARTSSRNLELLLSSGSACKFPDDCAPVARPEFHVGFVDGFLRKHGYHVLPSPLTDFAGTLSFLQPCPTLRGVVVPYASDWLWLEGYEYNGSTMWCHASFVRSYACLLQWCPRNGPFQAEV